MKWKLKAQSQKLPDTSIDVNNPNEKSRGKTQARFLEKWQMKIEYQEIAPLISQINAASSFNTAAQAQTVPTLTPVTLPPNNHVNPAIYRKPRKFQPWNGEKRFFSGFIWEVEDCIEIDRELMGPNRVAWFDIDSSLLVNAKQKHLKRTFGNKKEKEDIQEVLANLKQKGTQNFSDFSPKFDEALAGSGGEEWTEDSKLF
ncbi:hypothetical protein GcM1_215047 [Golovinomyces cichoracearum]|uniref:Uncharacterized protein n=1 Tax=Golovinomyces cichoracearum TaxID=62708 RepID=A0A420ITU7_9PEZI|nr:hypothetical protein GcM1_215047 [Golovinomyces cichoracearum]